MWHWNLMVFQFSFSGIQDWDLKNHLTVFSNMGQPACCIWIRQLQRLLYQHPIAIFSKRPMPEHIVVRCFSCSSAWTLVIDHWPMDFDGEARRIKRWPKTKRRSLRVASVGWISAWDLTKSKGPQGFGPIGSEPKVAGSYLSHHFLGEHVINEESSVFRYGMV